MAEGKTGLPRGADNEVPPSISQAAKDAAIALQTAREKVAKDYLATNVGLMPLDLNATADDGELISVHGAFSCPEHFDLKSQCQELTERLMLDGMCVRALVGFSQHPWRGDMRSLAVDVTLIIPIDRIGGE